MDRISAPPQNALLGRLADLLRLAETGAAGGPEFLPKGLDVMNLVRQLALPSAETVEKLSYGDPLFRMAPSGTGSRIPMTTDREYLADVAGMVPIAAPAARPSARGVQELVRQIQTEPPVGAVKLADETIQTGAMPKLQVQSDNFKNWFGDWQTNPASASKVIDESGSPKIVFHGTQRPDRIGTQFRKSRATSGPMSFFTDDPNIASGYATGKRDTSLAYEDTNYANWFKKKEGRSTLNLDQVGARMSAQEKQEVLDKLRRVGQDEQGNIVIGEPLVDDRTFDFMLRDPREAGGNPLKLANKLWLENGTLYGREEDFSKVLKAIGVRGFEEDFPTSVYPAVYPVYLDIKNPLNTMRIDQETLNALESAASRQKKPRSMGGADQWDKRMRDPQEWISQLKTDIAEGKNSMVWTSIPDWVTNTLKKRGFDGIEDVGGKSFGSPHTVWIPFEENQIKSATGNIGTFSKESKNILRSAAPIVGGGLLGAEMMQEEQTY